MRKIPIAKPYLDACEIDKVADVLKSGWLVQGQHVAEFERLFAAYVDIRYALATTNCTTALHLALDALGIGRGDQVLVPAFTYVATANAVEYTGAEVVFCDIDLRTFNIDLGLTEEILEKDRQRKIKAIIPVNLFGLCADMHGIRRLAERYGVKVVEDSACGFGAYIGGQHSGTFGDIGCFSFHPRKSITTGEGGMLVTNAESVWHTVRSLRDHGATISDLARHSSSKGFLLPDFDLRGYNYRMTDMQGAIGVCQMDKASWILERKRQIARDYDAHLPQALLTPLVPEGYTHSYQSYVCLFAQGRDLRRVDMPTIDELHQARNAAMTVLEERGIATRQGTHAVHTLGYYRKYGLGPEDFPMAYIADRLSIALPLYPTMSAEEYAYTITHIKEVMR